MMNDDRRAHVSGRLRRIEGQVRGIIGMVEDGRPFPDVSLQTSAAIAALRGVEQLLVKSHLETCVAEALLSDNEGTRE